MAVRVARSHEELPSRKDTEVTLRVVGVGVTRDNVVPVNALASAPIMLATPAFTHRFGPDYYAFDGALVQLAPGASKAGFSAAAQSTARPLPETGGNLQVADEAQQAAQVNHAIRPQAVALAGFALLTALAALFSIGQLLARQVFLVSDDNGALHALGMSRRQLLATGLAASRRGRDRRCARRRRHRHRRVADHADRSGPHRGAASGRFVRRTGTRSRVRGDHCAVASVCGLAGMALRGGHRGSGVHRGLAGRPSVLRRWATAAGAPRRWRSLGHAVEPGRGRTAVPSRTAIAVTAMAVAPIAAVVTFGANLSRLVETPRRYGQAWDVTIDSQFSPLPAVGSSCCGARSRASPRGHSEPIPMSTSAAGSSRPSRWWRTNTGVIAPTIVTGRAASRPNEVVFGTKTLEQIHLRVGQTVTR